ncbi:MAG: hypothetical protein ACK4N5_17860, partial [Myxococcales bacterium]
MNRLLAFTLLLLPVVALADEGGRKFDVKTLEREFAPLPVFFKKGAVVQNEVVISKDQTKDEIRAVYVVKAESSKVVDFYKEKTSVNPTKKGDEALGDVKY